MKFKKKTYDKLNLEINNLNKIEKILIDLGQNELAEQVWNKEWEINKKINKIIIKK